MFYGRPVCADCDGDLPTDEELEARRDDAIDARRDEMITDAAQYRDEKGER
jgi:hypothetical protein